MNTSGDMHDYPTTGDGYNENKRTQKDVLLDQRLKKFQADFAKEPPKVSAKDIIRGAFRKGKK